MYINHGDLVRAFGNHILRNRSEYTNRHPGPFKGCLVIASIRNDAEKFIADLHFPDNPEDFADHVEEYVVNREGWNGDRLHGDER